MDKFLVKENKVVLEISDFGTKGLGGPLSASESHEDDKDYDFVNFVKNFGSHKHKENQGENMDMESHLFSTLVAVEQ